MTRFQADCQAHVQQIAGQRLAAQFGQPGQEKGGKKLLEKHKHYENEAFLNRAYFREKRERGLPTIARL